jgi:lipopolysaccharide export system permease protein
MVFYFTNSTGEKMAKEGSIGVFSGMWLSTFVLLPIGLFLIYNALRDSQLFSKEFYYRFWRKLKLAYNKSGQDNPDSLLSDRNGNSE